MALAQKKSPFISDTEFCSQCGNILPLPGNDPVVTCKQCKFQIDVLEFDGLEIVTMIPFNKREVKTQGLTSDDFSGPTADRKCFKCGHEEMTYTTRQTRSADEGQTVFFTCPKCKAREIEYS